MSEVNYTALKNNMIYVIKENEIKVGYTPNSVGLNYPLDSLNRHLGTDCNEKEMSVLLKQFCRLVKDELGDIKVEMFDGKFYLTVPEKGVTYIHENTEISEFLKEFIDLFRGIDPPMINDILSVFQKYSECVECINVDNDEFNYIVYFSDGKPDEFIYCIDLDEDHASYHRLTPEDFSALGFDEYLR